MHSIRCYFPDRKSDLPLNSLKTKEAGFCKRATDVVVVKFFEEISRLLVAPWKFSVLKADIRFEGKYASFKNIII